MKKDREKKMENGMKEKQKDKLKVEVHGTQMA